MRGKRGMRLGHVRNCRYCGTMRGQHETRAPINANVTCGRDTFSCATGRPRGLFVLPILSRGTARPPWSAPLTFPAVPSHGRRVHSEARVVLWAVSRAVSLLKKAIPPSATSSASAHLIAHIV